VRQPDAPCTRHLLIVWHSIHMAAKARRESFSSVASSPGPRSQSATGNAGLTDAAGCYELHTLPEKARNIATSETRPDDEHDLSSPCQNSPLSDKNAMSRAPLLVRSSPAQGTGKLMTALSAQTQLHRLQPCRVCMFYNNAQEQQILRKELS
jgi:hypothetical protein